MIKLRKWRRHFYMITNISADIWPDIRYQKSKLVLVVSKDGQCSVSSASSSWNTRNIGQSALSLRSRRRYQFSPDSPGRQSGTSASSCSNDVPEEAYICTQTHTGVASDVNTTVKQRGGQLQRATAAGIWLRNTFQRGDSKCSMLTLCHFNSK